MVLDGYYWVFWGDGAFWIRWVEVAGGWGGVEGRGVGWLDCRWGDGGLT